MHPWRRSCISTGTLSSANRWKRSEVALGYGRHQLAMFQSAKSTDVNRPEKFAFCGPRVWNSLPSAPHDNNLSLNSEHVRVAISLHYLFAVVPFLQFWRRLKVWWSDVVVSALASINGVNLRRARLVLRWATVSRFNSRCRSAGHLFRYVTNQPPKANSAFHPSRVGR